MMIALGLELAAIFSRCFHYIRPCSNWAFFFTAITVKLFIGYLVHCKILLPKKSNLECNLASIFKHSNNFIPKIL